MKSQTIGIALFIALGLLVAGLLITTAHSMMTDTQDDLIKEVKKVENY